MHNILIFGAGKIGSLIACLLAESADYQVILADMNLDGADCKRVLKALPEISAQQLDINDADYIDGTILKDLNGLQEEMNIITVSHDHKKYLTILKAANILFKDNNEI